MSTINSNDPLELAMSHAVENYSTAIIAHIEKQIAILKQEIVELKQRIAELRAAQAYGDKGHDE